MKVPQWLAVIAILIYPALLLLMYTGCADPEPTLPLCSDVGCPDVALCTSDGHCVCIPPDEGPPGISCVLAQPE